MKKNTALTLIASGMVALLALTGCASSQGESNVQEQDENCTPLAGVETVKDGVLTVALTNTPPYSFEENGTMLGIDARIAEEFAAQECLVVEFAPYTYATAIPAIEHAQADIALGGFYPHAGSRRCGDPERSNISR